MFFEAAPYNSVRVNVMPIFEYACQSCGHRFEHLTREGLEPRCPACEGKALTKQLSTFAVSVGNGSSGSRADLASFGGGPCGTCGDPRGPGACSMN